MFLVSFTQGFRGCLDYVWCDKIAMSPVRSMPMPPLEAVTAFVALPSPEFPSDHLPVAADIRFTPTPPPARPAATGGTAE